MQIAPTPPGNFRRPLRPGRDTTPGPGHPRGALEIGAILARQLGGDLDVVLVRKLRAPASPELAIGAIDESGWTHIAPHVLAAGATDAYIEQERRS
ncbi:hypothetical protein WKW80_32690 [Variovorax humicola]|uniref:Uncharacterized protein n=1 Tax=Variovorax humicola TaxID=1769758 RepID=A0ABU8WB30_9BURK